MAFDMIPVIADAVRASGSPGVGSFTSADFSDAVLRRFDLRYPPPVEWAADVLGKLAGVVRTEGRHNWRLRCEGGCSCR